MPRVARQVSLGVAPPPRCRVPGLDPESRRASVEGDNELRPKGIPMQRLLIIAAGVAHLLVSAGRRPPRMVAFARSFAIVNLAFALGWINVIRGRGIEVWHRTEVRIEG